MIGPLIVVIGFLGLWALAKGKAGGVLDALTQTGFSTSLQNALGNLQLGAPTATGGGNQISPANGGSVTTNSANIAGGNDIGSHEGLVNGVVVTIDKTYAQMSDSEKDAANAFAHAIGTNTANLG